MNRIMVLVPAVVLATLLLVAAASATAQEYLPEYAGLAPISWAAGQSYSAAAQEIGSRSPNGTQGQDALSIEAFSARVGGELESALELRLANQLQWKDAWADPTGRAPKGSGLTDR